MENYVLASCTDKGKVRSVNEDSMITFDCSNGRVLVVCDGMGGQNAGDVASQLAVKVIQDILTDNTFATPEEAIVRSVVAANQAILRRAAQDESLSGMGSTCVMVIVKDDKVYYGSVGDSRIYYICNGMIRQITKDQSYVQTLVDEGQISQEDAEHHKDKNQITNALGIEHMTPPVVCKRPIVPEPGGIFLLCSDGLSGMINNNTILTVLSDSNYTLDERARQLVEKANIAGGLDNITVQLVAFPVTSDNNCPTGLTQQESTARVAVRGKKNNTVLIGVICLLLIAIVGGAAYWYFTKKEPTPQPQPQKPVVAPVKEENKTNQAPEAKKAVEETKEVIVIKEKSENGSSKKRARKDTLRMPKNQSQISGEGITGKDGNPVTTEEETEKIKMKSFTGNKDEKEP